MPKPNLIVFLTDQQRADTMACYGNTVVHAPCLNKLASESIIFERAYVTQPLCTPSRASLFTGMWPHRHGCTRNGVPLDRRHRTFAELLEDEDYHPGYMGKWQLGDEAQRQRGFRDWISTEGVSDYSRFLLSLGYPADKPHETFSERAVSELPLAVSKPKFLERYACDFIQKHQRDPFVLFISFVEPHSPYNGPLNNEHSLEEIELDATARMPAGDRIPLRYRLMRQWQEAEAVLDRARLRKLLFFGITQEEYREMKQRYFGLITMVDQSIGAILSCLERFDLSDHTIVMHTSDHGDSLGAHHLFGKEVMFEEAVRVPYLVRMPGQRRNSRIAQPISHIDFLPTVMELLGRPVPVQCAGISRVSLLRGEAMTPESVFIEWSPNRTKVVKGTSLAPRRAVKRACDESTRAIVTADGWKICFRDKDMNELYNFKNDPIEAENLWDNRSQASVVDRAREELHQWQETVGDRLSL
jgi:arylsulfatase A-like enzyme